MGEINIWQDFYFLTPGLIHLWLAVHFCACSAWIICASHAIFGKRTRDDRFGTILCESSKSLQIICLKPVIQSVYQTAEVT